MIFEIAVEIDAGKTGCINCKYVDLTDSEHPKCKIFNSYLQKINSKRPKRLQQCIDAQIRFMFVHPKNSHA